MQWPIVLAQARLEVGNQGVDGSVTIFNRCQIGHACGTGDEGIAHALSQPCRNLVHVVAAIGTLRKGPGQLLPGTFEVA